MSKTHVIDGKTYAEVERKANVGEKVVGINSGNLYEVAAVTSSGIVSKNTLVVRHENYRVLEPVDQAPANTDAILDLIANLVRRVAALESQLRDTQNNVERQGVEIAEVAHLAKSNEADIRDLDERTQPKPCENKSVATDEPQVFDLAKISTFKLSDLAGKTLRVHSVIDTAEGISVTTTIAIDVNDGKMYVLESEVVGR